MFLDRTSSKRLVAILRQAGFVFQTIYECYPNHAHETVEDPEWIKKCGENNWIVVTGDKRIETNVLNRQAVIDAKVKVFLLNDSNSKPEIWAAAILLGQYKMQDIIDGTQGPFFVTVGRRCDSHIQRPRRPAGWVDPNPPLVTQAPAEESAAVLPEQQSAPENNPPRPVGLFDSLS
jgi:PIN like domain